MSASPEDSKDSGALKVLLDEYRELSSDIRARVDLQHRNVSLLVVLMTAITGYLFNYWNDHGLQHGANALVYSEVAALIVVAPLFANVFVWRHLDHDANIIDKATYIDTVIRPGVSACAGGASLLDFEGFLRKQRLKRPWKVGAFVLLGNEHMIMLLFMAAYLAAGWYLWLDVPRHAGEARHLFDVLLYVSTGLFAASSYMSIVTAVGYGRLGARADQEPAQHAPPATE